MNELIKKNGRQTTVRLRLLASASLLSFVVCATSTEPASARDNDKPTVWIELDGQLSRLQDGQEPYAPPFVSLTPSNLSSPRDAEKPPRFSIDGTGSLVFQPKGTEWTFSASIRYGRASNDKHAHSQSYPLPTTVYEINRRGRHFYFTVLPSAARFTDAVVKQSETYAIIDFQVGKDVGLGLFGTNGVSSLNAGIRFAQFESKSQISLHEDPDWRFDLHVYGPNYYGFITQAAFQPYHSFAGSFRADRSFHGVGPSLSWQNSMRVAGTDERTLLVDWGLNAAVLFGRQKARTQHETTALYHPPGTIHPPPPVGYPSTVYHHAPPPKSRSQSVVVPNVGAFAGVSFKYPNAKVSFGYKADFFFGAMDGGIDVRRAEDVGFHGPYASVSIGLGG